MDGIYKRDFDWLIPMILFSTVLVVIDVVWMVFKMMYLL